VPEKEIFRMAIAWEGVVPGEHFRFADAVFLGLVRHVLGVFTELLEMWKKKKNRQIMNWMALMKGGNIFLPPYLAQKREFFQGIFR
jgi:hypothetical protein